MKKVLCIVDMQNDFVTGSLGGDTAKEIVPHVCKLITGESWENIIFTRDTHTTKYLDTQEGSKLPIEHCIQNTPGWELVPEVAKAINDVSKKGRLVSKAINKVSFGSMEWRDRIGKTVDEIHVCGLCTDICVLANVVILKTMYPEIPVIVHYDACAATTDEMQERMMRVFGSLQTELVP